MNTTEFVINIEDLDETATADQRESNDETVVVQTTQQAEPA